MKTKLLFSIFVCLSMAFNSVAQQCAAPPNCILNGDLVGPTTSGDMNTTGPLTVPNWWVSHGTPTYGPSQVWMWSYGGWGEGIYTCYNFIPGHQYRVCIRANYAGTNTNGNMLVDACNGLTQSFTMFGTMPTPPMQFIGSTNITSTGFAVYSYIFTPSIAYSQLWIRPFEATNDHATQYAITVDNVHVEDLSLPNPVISITPSGPYVNGVPVNLTAGGAPAGTTYNWSPSGFVGNPLTVVPTCEDQVISVVATYNNCPTAGVVMCQRRTQPTSITVKATEGCCATVRTRAYCNGPNGMMDFWITNTSTFNFNAYRLHILPSNAVVDWNNAISIPVGMTGGPYTINLSALGLAPGTTVCFWLEMIRYGAELCPEETCKTDRFCITVPEGCVQQDCCGDWGLIAYDDYSDPKFPVSRLVNCGEKIKVPCGKVNGFDFSYNCKEGCAPFFKGELSDPSGTVIWSGASMGSSPWYHIGNLPLHTSGVYTLKVYVFCGDKLCGTCELYLIVNCDIIEPSDPQNPSSMVAHSIIPNPANSVTTFVSRIADEPIMTYAIQTVGGLTVLSGSNINSQAVTVDIRSLPNGLYSVIINDKYTYKLIKQE